MSDSDGRDPQSSNDQGTDDSPVCLTERKYQKKLLYNDHLPYAQFVEEEGNSLFEDIKTNLSLAIQKSELWPGTIFWTNRLGSFLRAYDLQMSKDDHVHLVKVVFSLVTIPNLESPLLRSWSSLLVLLLKKWKLLSRDELTLPWRPLQELIQQVFFSKFKDLGMKIYSAHTESAVQNAISHARVYFPEEATREILDEWLPYLCPFDTAAVDALTYMELLLPTVLPPQLHPVGFRLWFEKLMKLWLQFPCPPSMNELLARLIVRLAKHNIGYIDWSPYIAQIFNRILKSFQLPVGPKEYYGEKINKKVFLSPQKAASFIISMMGGDSSALKNLAKLMQAVESFYHPSNLGRHTRTLLVFLKVITSQFLLRIKRERHNKKIWYDFRPKAVYLTEDDIDMFVGCLLPSARMAIFSKMVSLDPAVSLQNLAQLRPEVVLPDLLDRTYMALETLIEPHQLVAVLQCVAAVGRVLLSGGWGRFPEGRSHLFSLLTLALPGIDPNDFRKTLMSGMVISTLVTLVPIVDCSVAVGHVEMSESEKELCLMTAQFEDFVMQFLDRCFALIESTGLEQVASLDRMISTVSSGNHESIMGLGTVGALHSMLIQCSPSIFQVALKKLFHFATTNVFESEVSGKTCADMCSAAAKVNAVETLKLFVPYCIHGIKTSLEDPEQQELEYLDRALIWNIQLLSQVLFGQGDALLPYAEEICSCLKSCVHLKCKSAALYAAKALLNILHCITATYPIETRSTAQDFSSSPVDYLYINDWAASGNFNHLRLCWHEPNPEEIHLCEKILHEFLKPELNMLEEFINKKHTDRDSLQQSLQLILQILLGAAAYLPMLSGTQVEGCPASVVPMKRRDFLGCARSWKVPEEFSRETLANFVHKVLDHILKHEEDDTKSILSLIKIISCLLLYNGVYQAEFNGKWKAYMNGKMLFDDKLHGKKSAIRPMMITRVQLQHEIRVLERSMCATTELHLLLINDLFRLSISSYAEVRIKAQAVFGSCLDTFLYSGRKVFPNILQVINNESVTHEEFKGTLHLLLIPSVYKTFLHDWELLSQALKAIVQAHLSEKPSIQNLINNVVKAITTQHEYFTLQWKIPDTSIEAAAALHSSVTSAERDCGRVITSKWNETSISVYSKLVEDLVNLIGSGKLQWRHCHIGAMFLLLLVRHDHYYPACGVKLITDNLIHDTLAIRKISIAAMNLILQQQKRKHVKIPVDIAKEAGVECISDTLPGERDDNKWLCYRARPSPCNKEEYDTFAFVDKTHWGYYCWPKTLYTYAPYGLQPPLNRRLEDIPKHELPVYEAFSSPEFVSKLVSFLSLEENKGRDRFDTYKFHLFKGIFRNFGNIFLPLFKPDVRRMALHRQENYQRCASEILSGVVCGSKNWNYDMVMELKSFVEPLFKEILDFVSPETVDDWAACVSNISANRDPERLDWLLDLLISDPLPRNSSAFSQASRLYLLQSTMAQQEWRIPEVQHILFLCIQDHIAHPSKSVRERIGSMLSQVYLYDTHAFGVKFNPTHADFVRVLLKSSSTLHGTEEDVDRIRVCKTGLQWVLSCTENSYVDVFEVLMSFLPLIIVDDDEEIVQLIKMASAQMSNCELSSEDAPVVLRNITTVVLSELWRVTIPSLHLLQVLIYKNLFTFDESEKEVLGTIISLLENPQLEVRELAASTLGGLIRCRYVADIKQLKTDFIERSHVKLPKKGKVPSSSYEGLLIKRHSGVLGLTALVESCPYTVPAWLPEVLHELAQQMNEEMTIRVTVRRTIAEFKRTHQDSWTVHKQQFSDEQLAVLTDLLISPTYYA